LDKIQYEISIYIQSAIPNQSFKIQTIQKKQSNRYLTFCLNSSLKWSSVKIWKIIGEGVNINEDFNELSASSSLPNINTINKKAKSHLFYTSDHIQQLLNVLVQLYRFP
jgi:hypothetical protein